MFINPQIAIDNGWITGIKDVEKQTQPNAIDFTLDHLFSINRNNTFMISEENKQMRGGSKIEPLAGSPYKVCEPYWLIEENSVYDGMSDVYVTLPEGVAAMLIVRSTFNRNGMFITSGLYDSGFEGNIGFAIHNRAGRARIVTGTRIGQIIFVESSSAGLYAGQYNTEEGQHWSSTVDTSDNVEDGY